MGEGGGGGLDVIYLLRIKSSLVVDDISVDVCIIRDLGLKSVLLLSITFNYCLIH